MRAPLRARARCRSGRTCEVMIAGTDAIVPAEGALANSNDDRRAARRVEVGRGVALPALGVAAHPGVVVAEGVDGDEQEVPVALELGRAPAAARPSCRPAAFLSVKSRPLQFSSMPLSGRSRAVGMDASGRTARSRSRPAASRSRRGRSRWPSGRRRPARDSVGETLRPRGTWPRGRRPRRAERHRDDDREGDRESPTRRAATAGASPARRCRRAPRDTPKASTNGRKQEAPGHDVAELRHLLEQDRRADRRPSERQQRQRRQPAERRDSRRRAAGRASPARGTPSAKSRRQRHQRGDERPAAAPTASRRPETVP